MILIAASPGRILRLAVRWLRVAALSGLIALGLLGLGWAIAASRSSKAPVQKVAAGGPSRRVRIARDPLPLPRIGSGGACLIAAGSCSLTPCVELVGGAGTASSTTAAASAVLELDRLSRVTGVHIHAGRQIGQPACQGHFGMPRILLVGSP